MKGLATYSTLIQLWLQTNAFLISGLASFCTHSDTLTESGRRRGEAWNGCNGAMVEVISWEMVGMSEMTSWTRAKSERVEFGTCVTFDRTARSLRNVIDACSCPLTCHFWRQTLLRKYSFYVYITRHVCFDWPTLACRINCSLSLSQTTSIRLVAEKSQFNRSSFTLATSQKVIHSRSCYC
jgi:hypothetical protein